MDEMLVFIIAIFALSWIVQITAIIQRAKIQSKKGDDGSEQVRLSSKLVMLTMLTPTIVLLIFIAFGHIPLDWDVLGLRSPSIFGWFLGPIVPFVYTLATLFFLRRFAHVKNFSIEKDGKLKLENVKTLLDKWVPPPKKPLVYIFDFFITVLLVAILTLPLGLGEELVWRGYLQPIFVERFGMIPGILILGLVWGFWHLPINLAGYNDSEAPKLNAFVLFIVQTIAMSFVFGWIRIVTGSVWPVALAHMAHNVMCSLPKIFLEPRISHVKFQVAEALICVPIGAIALLLILFTT